MSSLNFSSINNNGELLACPCLRDCAKQLPSLFPLVTNGQMHGKWTRLEGNSLLHLEFCVGNGQSQPWSLGSWGSTIPAIHKRTACWALACTRAWFWGKFPSRKSPQKTVFVNKEGYPSLVWFTLLLCLLFVLQSRLFCALARGTWWHQRVNCNNFLCVLPTKTSGFAPSAT